MNEMTYKYKNELNELEILYNKKCSMYLQNYVKCILTFKNCNFMAQMKKKLYMLK